MKTLHWLNKQIMYMMLFLASHSGNGFTLFVVFWFDVAMNTIGVQTFFGARLGESIADAFGLSKAHVTAIGLFFAFFASVALGLSIMQSTVNNRKIKSIILSIFSICITGFGLIITMIKVSTWQELLSFDNVALLIIITAITFVAPIVYTMNAGLFMEKIGATLESFNEASLVQMKKSFDAQIKDLGELDEMETQATVDKRKQKLKKKQGRKAPEKGNILVGEDFDINNL